MVFWITDYEFNIRFAKFKTTDSRWRPYTLNNRLYQLYGHETIAIDLKVGKGDLGLSDLRSSK